MRTGMKTQNYRDGSSPRTSGASTTGFWCRATTSRRIVSMLLIITSLCLSTRIIRDWPKASRDSGRHFVNRTTQGGSVVSPSTKRGGPCMASACTWLRESTPLRSLVSARRSSVITLLRRCSTPSRKRQTSRESCTTNIHVSMPMTATSPPPPPPRVSSRRGRWISSLAGGHSSCKKSPNPTVPGK